MGNRILGFCLFVVAHLSVIYVTFCCAAFPLDCLLGVSCFVHRRPLSTV